MATIREQLVGRAAELGSLDSVVEGVRQGRAATVLIAGEPGIGKTRLLAELAARADARGCVVLPASASELEADLPFWIFVDALDEYVAGLDPRRLSSLDDDARAELAYVLPSLSDAGGHRGPAQHDERYRTHRAVRALLERLAATAPLVLVLDDLHWADPASVELLGALLRRPPSAQVVIAMAARRRQLPERLAGALERVRRVGALTELELAPLRREEARALLGDAIDGAVADALYGETGGNPFYLEQLARSARRVGAAAPDAAPGTLRGTEVPRPVAAAVAEELALLSQDTRRVLEGAAVAGDPFELELAAAAAGVDEPAAARAIDDLLAQDLIRPTDVPRRFGFRHPLIRRAVYDATPGGWLLSAHERCARALAERGASTAARAHHVEHAARQGDHEAVALLSEAGAGAAPRAPASAARWFGAALRLLPETAAGERRIELLTARAGALTAAGELAPARADLLETLALLPSEAVAPLTRLNAACAGIEHLLGEHAAARDRLLEALERLPAAAGPESVDLMIELAVADLFDAEFAAMRHWASRALQASRPLGDRALLAAAAGVCAIAEACVGAIDDARGHRAEAREIVEALSDDELARGLAAARFLANAELYLGHFRDATEHAARGLEVARATGQMSPTLLPALVTAQAMTGRVAEALQLLDPALESARAAGIPQTIAWTLVNRSYAELAAGELDAGIACAQESAAIGDALDERFMSAWAGVALGVALLQAGEPARGAEALVGRAGGEKLGALPAGWRPAGFEALVQCRLALGQRDMARRSLALAQLTAQSLALPMATMWAERAAAAVALAEAAPAAAAEHALAAAAAAERMGAVVEEARSRTLAGEALAHAGDAARAVAELERAVAALDAVGAARQRAAAERELRRLGRPVHRRTRKGSADGAGLETLTERERQIAALVVDRRTNQQIAAELFLSLKTVETHLRNIFRKLDVSSRVELARAVERAERPG